LSDNGMMTGRVEETIYIGTDTRYIIHLTDKMSVTVREQNLDPRQTRRYHVGDEVGLNWDPANAQILRE
jgi:spermidine/putrescine transport system ATP-binding protein